MDLYSEYKSPFGYETGTNGIDSYGVDHSRFSIRDELEYQTARAEREKQLMQGFNKQGITDNYPQYSTNFWGNAGNNYGFGSSNIGQNIQNVTNRLNNGGFVNRNNGQNSFSVTTNNDGWNYTTDLQKQHCINSLNMQCSPDNNNNLNMTSIYPDYSQPPSLEFDGQNFIWLQNGKPVKYYSAMSGKPNHQTAQDTNIPNAGPIPEGEYILLINSGEDHKPGEWRSFEEFISNTGLWKKNPDAWGYSRIPIKPLPNTNTFGRHSMYVHGGTVPGSAGCIDLTGRMEDFYNDFLKYKGDIPLKVKYKKGW